MWNIGAVELTILVLLALSVLIISGPRRRWLVAMVLVAVIGVCVTPPDPVSAVLVSVPLAIAFTCGVYFESRIRRLNGVMH